MNKGGEQPIENNDNIHMYNLPQTKTTDQKPTENKGFISGLLNKDITQIPCLKTSLLYGVGSGMFVLAVTSVFPFFKTKKFGPADFGVMTFLGVSSLFWPICNYNHNIHNQKVKLLMDAQVAEMNRKMAEKLEKEKEKEKENNENK